MNFLSQIFFNNINHGHRESISKKNSLWPLLFYMAVATYKKVRRMMRTETVSYILIWYTPEYWPKFQKKIYFLIPLLSKFYIDFKLEIYFPLFCLLFYKKSFFQRHSGVLLILLSVASLLMHIQSLLSFIAPVFSLPKIT